MEKDYYLHFSVGENFPKLIAGIAQEKLLYKLDIEGALDVFSKCLQIEDREVILNLLSGKDYGLSINVSTQEVTCVRRDESDLLDYPVLDSDYYINFWIESGLADLSEINSLFAKPNYINYSKNKTLSLDITLSMTHFMAIVMGHLDKTKDHLYESLINTYSGFEDEYFNRMIDLSRSILLCKDWILGMTKKLEVINFLISNNLGNIIPSNYSTDLLKLKLGIGNVYTSLTKVMELVELDELSEEYKLELRPLLIRDSDISEQLNHCILPVDIEDGYDAGWLSPDGKFFGMNGETSEMLHLQIADLLYEDGIIPSDYEDRKEQWFEDSGWVKIHHAWVLWQSDSIRNGGYVDRDLTPEQIDSIVRYGSKIYGGILAFGYRYARLTVTMFRSMDNIAKKKLFSVYN